MTGTGRRGRAPSTLTENAIPLIRRSRNGGAAAHESRSRNRTPRGPKGAQPGLEIALWGGPAIQGNLAAQAMTRGPWQAVGGPGRTRHHGEYKRHPQRADEARPDPRRPPQQGRGRPSSPVHEPQDADDDQINGHDIVE